MIKLRMDAALDAPVHPVRLIQILAKLTNQDAILLVEKFKKAHMSDPVLQEKINIAGMKFDFGDSGEHDVLIEDKSRMKKYEKFLKTKIDIPSTTFNKQDLKDRQTDLKRDWDFEELEKLDKLKQEFAAALFKKNKK